MFSAAKASERAKARLVSPTKKIASSDVILARTICVPVACVVVWVFRRVRKLIGAIQHPRSEIRHSTSEIRHPTFEIRHPTFDRMAVMCSARDQGTYEVRFERKQCKLFWFCLIFLSFCIVANAYYPVMLLH